MGFASLSATANKVWRIMLLRRFAGSSIAVESVSFGSSGNSSAGMPIMENLLKPLSMDAIFFFVYRNRDCFCRGLAYNVGKQLRAQHCFSGLLCGGGNDGGDTQFQIIGTQFEAAFCCADKDSLQRWNGRLCGDGPLYICDCFSHVAFADCKFHLMIHARFRKDPDRGVIL